MVIIGQCFSFFSLLNTMTLLRPEKNKKQKKTSTYSEWPLQVHRNTCYWYTTLELVRLQRSLERKKTKKTSYTGSKGAWVCVLTFQRGTKSTPWLHHAAVLTNGIVPRQTVQEEALSDNSFSKIQEDPIKHHKNYCLE